MAEAGRVIVFIAIHALIALAWWRFVRGRARDLSPSETLLCTGILSVAQIIATSLLLGWGGYLARGPLVALLLSGSAVVLIAAGHAVRRPAREGTYPHPAVLGAGILAGFNVALLALLAALLAATLVRGALVASTDWDGLTYHLPMSVLMRQTHALALGPVHNPAIEGYPKNAEIWVHWILSFFGDDRWVDVGQVPFLLLAILATYCVARRLGSGPATAAAGALLLPFSPVVLAQITTAYTDVTFSSLLLSAVALLLIVRCDASLPVRLSFGSAVGLLVGSKFGGLALAAPLLAAFTWITIRSRSRRHPAADVGLVAALVVLLGADVYVRNLWLHGNPVYPYRIPIPGLEIPGPWSPASVYGFMQTRELHPLARIARSWAAISVATHTAIFGGFGISWPFFAVVSALSLALSLRARDRLRLAVFALFCAFFLLTPLPFRVRFTIYLLGLGGVAFSHLLDRAAVPARALLMSAALAVAAFSTVQIARKDSLSLENKDPSSLADRTDACRRTTPDAFRDAYRWLRRNAPAGSTVVAFVGDQPLFTYCLWNQDLSNRVEFASATTPAALLEIATRRPSTILFLPHRADAYAQYAGGGAGLRELFANDQVTIATARSGDR